MAAFLPDISLEGLLQPDLDLDFDLKSVFEEVDKEMYSLPATAPLSSMPVSCEPKCETNQRSTKPFEQSPFTSYLKQEEPSFSIRKALSIASTPTETIDLASLPPGVLLLVNAGNQLMPFNLVNQKSLGSDAPATLFQQVQKRPLQKALSAYNYFFRHERQRILNDDQEGPRDYSSAERDRLLREHWNQAGKDKANRPHVRTHGKIGFATLSKLVAKRWKELPETEKEFYREVASLDLQRYKKEQRRQRFCPAA